MEPTEIIRAYSSMALAYIGDAAYEILVRDHLARSGEPVNTLHRKAKEFVSAAAQSSFMEFLEPLLTEEEAEVYRRGRNAKSHSHPKNAEIVAYRRATGFEALFGYLYLAGKDDRQRQLFEYILEHRAK